MTRERAVLLVLLLATAVGLGFQGSRSLWDPDEGRYSNVAHEMLDSGDWLIPHLDAERAHFSKPPLVYWLTAASLSIFGSSEWAVRLPNALAFIATALLVFLTMRRLSPERAPAAAAIWATMLLPVVAANIASADMLLTCFEALAVYGFVASGAVERSGALELVPRLLMWLGFGLAFATKGPPGLLPLAAIVIWSAWRWRGRGLPAIFHPAGLLVFAAIGLGWYLVVINRVPGLLDYFLHSEVVGRIGSSMHSRNPGWRGLAGAYGPVLLLGALPWTLLLLNRRWRQPDPAPSDPGDGRNVRTFLLAWLLIAFAVFAVAQSRLPLYLVPLTVPAAMLIASLFSLEFLRQRLFARIVLTTAIVLIVLKAVGAQATPKQDAEQLAREIRAKIDLRGVDELAFINMTPSYGLRHYLGKEIEEVGDRKEARVGFSRPQSLCTELGEGERVLFLARDRHLESVIDKAAGCGLPLSQVAAIRDLRLLRTMQPTTQNYPHAVSQ